MSEVDPTELAALRQVEQMARFVIDWDWTDNDEEPVSDVAELRYAVERLDAVRAVVAKARATESAADARPCTCHPDDNPPVPCPRMYALHECRRAAQRQEKAP